jgi:hypothetical protein
MPPPAQPASVTAMIMARNAVRILFIAALSDQMLSIDS